MLDAKSILVFLQVVVNVLSLNSQDLLVDGAEWYYTLTSFASGNRSINRCYIEGDTTIDGKTSLIYIQDQANCNGRPERNYLYKENDKVYFFDEDDRSFKLLYDFSLDVGDTMIYETGIHSWDHRRRTHYFRIDSIKQFSANSIELKSFDITYGYLDRGQIIFGEVKGQIIEDIGNTRNFFHFIDDTGYCDDKYSDSLRCFTTPDFPMISFSDVDCTTVPTFDQINTRLEIRSYPNPFVDELYLELAEPTIGGQIYLFDSWGRILHHEPWPLNKTTMILRLDELPPSIYWIRLRQGQDSNTTFSGKRIVKLSH